MLRLKRFWIGLVISLACLAFFLAHTNPSEIEHSFSDANLLLACAVTPLYFVGFWLRTIRWRYLLKPVADVSTSRLFPVVLIGLMANNIAPARVGELVRAYLVGERESMSKSTALGTIAVDRAFDGLTLVAILGVVIATSGNSAGLKSIGIGAALILPSPRSSWSLWPFHPPAREACFSSLSGACLRSSPSPSNGCWIRFSRGS